MKSMLIICLLVLFIITLYCIHTRRSQMFGQTISEWKSVPVLDNGYIAKLFGFNNDQIQVWEVGKLNLEMPNTLVHPEKIYLAGYRDGTCIEKLYLTELTNDVSTLGPIISQLPTTNYQEQYKATFLIKGWDYSVGSSLLADKKHVYVESSLVRVPELEFPGLIHVKGSSYKLMNWLDCGREDRMTNWNILFSDIKDSLIVYGSHQDLGTAYRIKGDTTEKIIFKTIDGSYITYEPLK